MKRIITFLLGVLFVASFNMAYAENEANKKSYRDIPKESRDEANFLVNKFKEKMTEKYSGEKEKLDKLNSMFNSGKFNESEIRLLAKEIAELRLQRYMEIIEFKIFFFDKYGVEIF